MTLQDRLCNRFHLKPAELLMMITALAILSLNVILVLLKGARIDLPAYTGILAIVLFTVPLGLFYRITGRSERIASSLICSGTFIFFSACLSLFNYMLLPVSTPLMDPLLASFDAMVGFNWPDVMHWAAEHPNLSAVFKFAYNTTLPQFALLVVILGLTGRARDLHVMITSVTITATLTICFWGVLPSMGPGTIYTLPPEVWNILGAVADDRYSAEIASLAQTGPGVISPKEIRGLIAFPSYHTVLAFTAMYAARNVPGINIAFLALNLVMLPGIVIHGSHHLMDLFGGFAMFAFGTWIATRAVTRDYERRGAPEFVAA
ncbi:MAG: phosphatase PAP2 family protein [Pseudomonadota bacterium]